MFTSFVALMCEARYSTAPSSTEIEKFRKCATARSDRDHLDGFVSGLIRHIMLSKMHSYNHVEIQIT